MPNDTEVFPSAQEQCAASRTPVHCQNSAFPDGRITCCESVRSCGELAAALEHGAVTCGGTRFCFSQWSVASGYCVQERYGFVAEVYPAITSAAPSSAPSGAATATITTTRTAGTHFPTLAVAPAAPPAESQPVAESTTSVPAPPNSAAKIAVPIALVALVLLGGGVFLLWCRRRRQQQWRQQEEELQQQPGVYQLPTDGNEKARTIAELHDEFTAELPVHSPPVELPEKYVWSAGKDVEISAAPRSPELRAHNSATQAGGGGDCVPASPQLSAPDGPTSPVSPVSPISSMGGAVTVLCTPVRTSSEDTSPPR